MTTTIIVAALGLVGTIGGVLLTQRRADRREATNLERAREREREQWSREDAARTFEQRRDAYVEFYEHVREMAFLAYNHGMGLNEHRELADEWHFAAFRRLQHLRIYASASVTEAAEAVYTAAWWWGHETNFGNDNPQFYERQDAYDRAEDVLLDAIRRDLRIPDDPLAEPPREE